MSDKVCISIPDEKLFSMKHEEIMDFLDAWLEMYAKYYRRACRWWLNPDTMEHIGCFEWRR